ncbi:TetR/AcrR family transcriptional regulator [Aerococcus urinaeequi]|uniref:TetR family transcriptional regulator n=2 Tax=Aerococcus viridans TaxID=1377 RepID=A0AAU8UJV5_9LACT|nr:MULTISPECIES: TetR/AcrR family transcriptional regulator [Lactobacillales]AMC00202.1 TetR family transcriptional regulator [Aerococcus viridans]EFG50568.1 transcriptional regulator, TetR family [Aerococcus viridans ATCC 11563 = CCUG 4311]MCK1189771.1 TetR/AcrR family transcriptional regulator [Streptococcus uberis]SUU10306.1 HTH-type transcriptional repressor KstR2 [Aerococcus viridans]
MNSEKFQDRNNNILLTAEKIINEKGYFKFRMEDVSDTLQIAKGTLYNHYKSKELLLFDLVYPKLNNLLDELININSLPICFEQKFQTTIETMIYSQYHQFLLFSYSDVATLFQDENQILMVNIQNQLINEFNKLIQSGFEEGKISDEFSEDFLSHQLLSVLNPLLHSLLVSDSNKMQLDEFIHQTSLILLKGMGV